MSFSDKHNNPASVHDIHTNGEVHIDTQAVPERSELFSSPQGAHSLKQGRSQKLTAQTDRTRLSSQGNRSHLNKASHRLQKNDQRRKCPVVAAVVGICVIAVAVFLIAGKLLGLFNATQPDSSANAVVPVSEQLEYHDFVYQIAQKDGKAHLVERLSDGKQTDVATCEGAPVALVLFDGAVLIPENTSGGWNIISYAAGSQSEPGYVTDKDGQAQSGQEQIVSVALQGNALVLTFAGGGSQSVSLAG